jgi:hypothetical protein
MLGVRSIEGFSQCAETKLLLLFKRRSEASARGACIAVSDYERPGIDHATGIKVVFVGVGNQTNSPSVFRQTRRAWKLGVDSGVTASYKPHKWIVGKAGRTGAARLLGHQ